MQRGPIGPLCMSAISPQLAWLYSAPTAGNRSAVDTWISTGKNEVISSIEVGQAIGIEKVKKLAEAAGVDVNKARDLLAEYLPVAIDKATPEGKLPPKDKAA
jgi:uncharacterized protein YidB (DUF937 family)